MWKTIKKSKKTIIIICLFFFLLSNNIDIDGGSCGSSPCSELDSTKSEELWKYDYVITSKSNIFVAPSAILIEPVLKVTNLYEISKHGNHSYIHFDKANEKNNKQMAIDDSKFLLLGALLIKLIILLSLPFWIFVCGMIIHLHKKKPFLAILTIFIIAFYILNWSLLHINDIGGGYSYDGWDLFNIFIKSIF
ncbi:hypothetical protein JKY72_06350 [Candidatus Gracilibacteria bacterium]|nr:hypothetical protein [Candidatus Gracilibacteria bacterium]